MNDMYSTFSQSFEPFCVSKC